MAICAPPTLCTGPGGNVCKGLLVARWYRLRCCGGGVAYDRLDEGAHALQCGHEAAGPSPRNETLNPQQTCQIAIIDA
jgi:hypothetical protein